MKKRNKEFFTIRLQFTPNGNHPLLFGIIEPFLNVIEASIIPGGAGFKSNAMIVCVKNDPENAVKFLAQILKTDFLKSVELIFILIETEISSMFFWGVHL